MSFTRKIPYSLSGAVMATMNYMVHVSNSTMANPCCTVAALFTVIE
jgi:hypothetical protein